jgi:hypothetical protein
VPHPHVVLHAFVDARETIRSIPGMAIPIVDDGRPIRRP